MNKQKFKFLAIVSTLMIMVFAFVATSSAQTGQLPSGCTINEVGDTFIEIYCLNASTGITVESTNETRATYAFTAAPADSYVTAVATGLLADAAGDGLSLTLMQAGATETFTVAFSAAELDMAQAGDNTLENCTISRDADATGAFMVRDNTMGAVNTDNTTMCSGMEALSVALSGTGSTSVSFGAVFVAMFTMLAAGTVVATRRFNA